MKWGDEVEYIIVKLDHKEKKARLRKTKQLYKLNKNEEKV